MPIKRNNISDKKVLLEIGDLLIPADSDNWIGPVMVLDFEQLDCQSQNRLADYQVIAFFLKRKKVGIVDISHFDTSVFEIKYEEV